MSLILSFFYRDYIIYPCSEIFLILFLSSLHSDQGFTHVSAMFSRLFATFLNQGSLHLSKTRQESYDQGSESSASSGVDQSIQIPEVDPLSLRGSSAIDQIHPGTSQAFRFEEKQFTPLPHHLQAST